MSDSPLLIGLSRSFTTALSPAKPFARKHREGIREGREEERTGPIVAFQRQIPQALSPLGNDKRVGGVS